MALSEGSIGWIPYMLARAAFTHRHDHARTMSDFGGKKPSDVFSKHIITCFIEDESGLRNLPDIGEDMVTWEYDYPHSDCTWPGSPGIFHASTNHLTDAQIDKIGRLSAMREFTYDPFPILWREDCCVGALRKLAANVSTAPTLGRGGARPVCREGKPATSGDINKIFAAADVETAL